jgi:hypothetical protein
MLAGDELAVSAGPLVGSAADPTHPELATSAETERMIAPFARMVF